MRIGAIDIGTNAVRLIVKEVRLFQDSYYSHKVCYTRVPIRLGEDVFTEGKVGEEKVEQLTKTITAFKYLLDVQGVNDFRACSTSAMREADNGGYVIDKLKNKTGVEVEIISGAEEAELIMANFASMNLEAERFYLYIDVGGGSTEISLIKEGQIILSRSFKIGTVRLLHDKVIEDTWAALHEFCAQIDRGFDDVVAIGTGGNINRIFKEAGKHQLQNISLDEIAAVKERVGSYSFEERLHLLKLKPDRADVILPAADIYLEVMQRSGVWEMMVPKIGLSDGLILRMFDEMQARNLS